MRDTLKILLAKARLDDTVAVNSLLLPIQEYGNLTKMFSEHRSGFSYAYEEESRVGRFVASNGVTLNFVANIDTNGRELTLASDGERFADSQVCWIRGLPVSARSSFRGRRVEASRAGMKPYACAATFAPP